MFAQRHTINIQGKLMDFDTVRIMGILNVTPDSFYDGGKYLAKEKIKARVVQIIDEGADIIDLGGMSSRPGAEVISTEEEWNRLEPALAVIREAEPDIPISVDTFRAEIAEKAVSQYKAGIINDISAGEMDKSMFDFIADTNTAFIMMHMKGTPAGMQKNPEYEDIVADVMRYFHQKLAILREKGVRDIIIDPGFGFGKTLDHNYELFNYMDRLAALECPVLAGISRKSMITRLFDISPEESLNGTTSLHTLAISKGAGLLRVHDVAEAKQVVRIMKKLESSINPNW
ncbi:MAG: dihydropteroate synthase [Bacteroidota bacterium]